jgi:hypothetical protein
VVVGDLSLSMKAIIGCLLCCLSVFAADTNEIGVVTRTDSHISPGYLVTYEEYTRGGQTNLLRVTSVKDGVTNHVLLDSFTCTNGIFYPEDSSRIEESNRKTKNLHH